MFRCGSSYQDRPCDAGQPSKVIGSNGASREQAAEDEAPTKADAECTALGNRAKQVVWAKETGKTAEAQLAAAASENDRRLIADVYSRRGSSVVIAKGIEGDCMADKERMAQAAALIEAGRKLQGQGGPALASAQPAPARPVEAAEPRQATPSNTTLLAKNARCQAAKEHLGDVTSAQRVGGSVTQMEQLNRQRQAAAKALRDAGC